jgi:uncharacterized coiled-coil protein SlyX
MISSDERRLDGARIDELETRVAEQDQSILELSDELYRQQRQIAELEAQLRRLVERVKTLSAPEPAPDPDEIPPHY